MQTNVYVVHDHYLSLRMTTAQVVETLVTLNNSPIQGCAHPDHHAQPTYEMTPGFYPYQYGQKTFFLWSVC